MTSSYIARLNRMLDEGLGRIGGGARPRFCWMESHTSNYYLRPSITTDFEEHSWADTLGRCWLLAGWRLPVSFDMESHSQRPMTKDDWWNIHHGASPYPEQGEYYGFPETAIAPGMLPTIELTMNYIWAIDKQASARFANHQQQIKDGLAKQKEAYDVWWTDYTQSFNPAFSNFNSGSRGSNVSFGGI